MRDKIRGRILCKRKWETTNLSEHLESPKDKALSEIKKDLAFNGLSEGMYKIIEWGGSTKTYGVWFLVVDPDIYSLIVAWRGIDPSGAEEAGMGGDFYRKGAIAVETMKHLVGICRGGRG